MSAAEKKAKETQHEAEATVEEEAEKAKKVEEEVLPKKKPAKSG